MRGFLRMAALDFDTWNNAATVEANENGEYCDLYTYCLPDSDGSRVWARVEHEFALKDFGITTDGVVLSREQAIAAGMME